MLSNFSGNVRRYLYIFVALLMAGQVQADESIELMSATELLAQADPITDEELSCINGKNNTAVLDEQRIAVILWDEGGNDGRRDAVRVMSSGLSEGNTSAQRITYTVTLANGTTR